MWFIQVQAILLVCYFSWTYCFGKGLKLKSLDVEMACAQDANELATTMRKRLAYDRFLHIEFQMSSFCLGRKVIISVFRDDEKIFKKNNCCEDLKFLWSGKLLVTHYLLKF